MIKRKISVLLACVLPAALLAGCRTDEGNNYPGTLEDVSVWCVPATEKVLKTASADDYSDVATDTLEVLAAKGEYESAQIILTAQDTLAYEVKANDLHSDGSTFSAGNIEVFHEEYINVSSPFGSVPAGQYPDALVPYENAVSSGENVVPKDENQGLYVRFYIPADQAAGTYTGSITVTVAGESVSVPVSLEIRNVTVSSENHTQSIFLNEWLFYKGELDSTQEMFDKYNEALYEYRLNPNMLLYDFDVESDEGIAAYVDKAWEYVQKYEVSTISLPYSTERVDANDIDVSSLKIEDSDGMYVSDPQYDFTQKAVDAVHNDTFGTYETVDAAVMTKYLKAFSEKSFTEGVDLVSKLVTYYRLIDETRNDQGYSTVKLISLVSRNTANKLADEYLAAKGTLKTQYPGLDAKAKANGYASADEFIEAVAESLYDLYHIVTIAANTDYEEILPYLEGGCPLFDYYDTEEVREDFYSQTQKWWYGCVAPTPPYATYRIDDSMLSPRMVSWMQAQYGVVGNLYWSTNIYAQNSNWTYQEIYDYYGGNAERYPGANGDGYLFYPGEQYGVDGPVASMRLEAIRDGLEEYELLYALQEKYQGELAADENGDGVNDYFCEMMEGLTSDLYLGTVVTADEEAFVSAREQLLTLAELAVSPVSFVLTGQTDDGEGNVTLTFAAASDADIKLAADSCGSLSDPVGADGMNMYSVAVDMRAADSNTVRISMEKDGRTFTYEQYLGGRVTVNEVNDGVTEADLAKTENGVDAVFAKQNGMLTATLSAPRNNRQQQAFTLTGSLLTGVGADTAEISIVMQATEGRTISVYLVGSSGEVSLTTVTFGADAQTVVLSFGSVNWNRIGTLQSLRFVVAGADSETVVGIGRVLVYGK